MNDVPSIPFTVHVEKSSECPFGLFFWRFSPQDFSPKLPWSQAKRRPPVPDNFRAQLEDKVGKLAPYKICAKTTVLLIESGDIAFMNPQIMLSWIKEEFPNNLPDGVDQMWYAARYNDSDFGFKDFTSDIRRSY